MQHWLFQTKIMTENGAVSNVKAKSVNISHLKYSGPQTSHQSNPVPIENQDQSIVAKCMLELRSESCAILGPMYFKLKNELFNLLLNLNGKHFTTWPCV